MAPQVSLKSLTSLTISICIVLGALNLNFHAGGFLGIIFLGGWWIVFGNKNSLKVLSKYHGLAFSCGLIWYWGACIPISHMGDILLTMNLYFNVYLAFWVCVVCFAVVLILHKCLAKTKKINSLKSVVLATLIISYLSILPVCIITLADLHPGDNIAGKLMDLLNIEGTLFSFVIIPMWGVIAASYHSLLLTWLVFLILSNVKLK